MMNTIGTVVGHGLWSLFSCLVKGTMVVGATLVAYGALDVITESTAVNVGLAGLVALLAGKYLFFAKHVAEVAQTNVGVSTGENHHDDIIDRINDHYLHDERTSPTYSYRGDNIWYKPDIRD